MCLSRSLLTCIVIVWRALSPTLVAQESQSNKCYSHLAAKNILTRVELDKLSFGPQMTAEIRIRNKPIKKYVVGKQPWKLGNSYQDLKLGAWMSKKEFKIGEPLHVLFVLKNEGRGRGLDMWLTVSAQGKGDSFHKIILTNEL